MTFQLKKRLWKTLNSGPSIGCIVGERISSYHTESLVLGEVESCMLRNKSREETKHIVEFSSKKHLMLHSNTAKGVNLLQERKKDHYSHYILLLAFCKSDELRRRFVRAETALFKLRFEQDDSRERQAFLESLDLGWRVLSYDEKTMLRNELKAASPSVSDFEKETFFVVDWIRVVDLIAKRRVFVKHGKAYVPQSEQISLVLTEFSRRLEKKLELSAKALPRLDEDDRLIPILNHLSLGFIAPTDYAPKEGSLGNLTAEQIDTVIQHFPLCMRHLHTTLRRDKHLRHFGRLQYTLFLKGIGLSVDECLIFWRKAFSNINDDKFNKEYRYNVRHAYGLEGSRINYKPKSCQQILTNDQPGPGDNHGCPFRHFSPDNLMALVSSQHGVSPAATKEIMEQVRGGHYHLACTRLWEVTHENSKIDETITHPNEYFEKSLQWGQAHAPAEKMKTDW